MPVGTAVRIVAAPLGGVYILETPLLGDWNNTDSIGHPNWNINARETKISIFSPKKFSIYVLN